MTAHQEHTKENSFLGMASTPNASVVATPESSRGFIGRGNHGNFKNSFKFKPPRMHSS